MRAGRATPARSMDGTRCASSRGSRRRRSWRRRRGSCRTSSLRSRARRAPAETAARRDGTASSSCRGPRRRGFEPRGPAVRASPTRGGNPVAAAKRTIASSRGPSSAQIASISAFENACTVRGAGIGFDPAAVAGFESRWSPADPSSEHLPERTASSIARRTRSRSSLRTARRQRRLVTSLATLPE
jgi:hypothetical protein